MKSKKGIQSDNPGLGIVFAIIGFFCMAVVSTLLKAMTLKSSAPWANFSMYVSGSFLLACYLLRRGFSSLKTEHFSQHIGRAFFGVIASFSYCASTQFIPLIDATLLFNTTPIFIPIFAIWMLGSKPTLKQWLAIFIGFIGIATIIHPSPTIFEHPGDLLGLSSGITLAIAYIFIKMLTKTDSHLEIVAYFFFLATLFQIPFILLFGPFPPSEVLLLSVFCGISFLLAQWAIVKSYQLASATVVGMFQYLTVVFSAVFDWMIWNVSPTLQEIVGTLIVILSVMYMIFITDKSQKERNSGS